MLGWVLVCVCNCYFVCFSWFHRKGTCNTDVLAWVYNMLVCCVDLVWLCALGAWLVVLREHHSELAWVCK